MIKLHQQKKKKGCYIFKKFGGWKFVLFTAWDY